MFAKGKIISIVLFIVFVCNALGEGTIEITKLSTSKGKLQIMKSFSDFALYNSNEANRLNITICNVGEVVYFGFGRVRNGSGTSRTDVTYRIKNPSGTVVKSGTLTNSGAGYISSYDRAVAGPTDIVGALGYDALSFVPAVTGDYYIEFNYNTANGDRRVFDFFDITVATASNQAIKGRIWSKAWQFTTGNFTNQFDGTLYIYADDGIITSLDFNGMQPYVFTISANATGCFNSGNPYSDRMSTSGLHTYPQYKIFFNEPDTNCYPVGNFGNIVAPTTFSGCTPEDFCINITVDKAGRVEIILDLNGIDGYQPNTEDVFISYTVVVGTNCIPWNGLDGLGKPLSVGTSIKSSISFLNGITHIPLYDVEQQQNGYIVRIIKPVAIEPIPPLFWDDTKVGGGTQFNGCYNATGCHTWNGGENWGIGNVNTVNTWWYAYVVQDSFPFNYNYITVDANINTPIGESNDTTVCGADGIVNLNGGVTFADGVIWTTTGTGTFLNGDTAIQGIYELSALDKAQSSIKFYITSTNNHGCPGRMDSMTVFTNRMPITGAGIDRTICMDNNIGLAGSIRYSSGGIWFGGDGTFMPNNTKLNATYAPTQDEINAKTVTLGLASFPNGVCPSDTDYVTFYLPTLNKPTLVDTIRPSCYGFSDGSITIGISGGDSPYTYIWNNGTSDSIIDSVQAGMYMVTISDANGCVQDSVFSLNQPSVIVPIAGMIPVNCYGGSDGKAFVTVLGGTSPYNYLWDDALNSTTDTVVGLPIGLYTVTVTDDNACTTTASVNIIQPIDMSAEIVPVKKYICNGASDGRLQAFVSGGTAPYTYNWSNGSITNQASNLIDGIYSLTVNDSKGCQNILQDTIVELTPVVGLLDDYADVSCHSGNDGWAKFTASGGAGVYTFNTNPGNKSGDSISDLNPRKYNTTVTDSMGCFGTFEFEIGKTPLVKVELLYQREYVTCNGDSDGVAIAVATGGTRPFTYTWNTTPVQSDSFATGLYKSNAHKVTITDINGCFDVATGIIKDPPILELTVGNIKNVSCANGDDGEATVIVTGGIFPYRYSWSTSPVQTSETAKNLEADIYTVYVTDTNNCQQNINFTITEPLPLNLNITKDDITCFSYKNGVVYATVTGGTTPYTLNWSDDQSSTDTLIDSLNTGTYQLYIEDAKGCQISDSIEINEPALLQSNLVVVNTINCFGNSTGSIEVNPTGGTLPYSFAWDNGQTDSIAVNLGAGTYSVTVTDDNGCTSSNSITLSQPTELNVTTTLTHVACFGGNTGRARMNPTGGSIPYSYSWSDGRTTQLITGLIAGSYGGTVTDAKGCSKTITAVINQQTDINITFAQTDNICFGANAGTAQAIVSGGLTPYTYSWSSTQITATINNLLAGDYVITITDRNNCQKSNIVTILEPSEIIINTTKVDATCNVSNGMATASASGGNGPYTYTWNTTPPTYNDTINNVDRFVYIVSVKDNNNCIVTKNIEVNDIAVFILEDTAQATSCYGMSDGEATIIAKDGLPPYTIVWSTYENLSDTIMLDVITTIGDDTTSTITGLIAGQYYVAAKDGNGCEFKLPITITQPAPLVGDIIVSRPYCKGDSNAIVELVVAGGNFPYTYSWSNGDDSFIADSLWAGVHSVYIIDSLGCDTTINITISEPDSISFEFTTTHVLCKGMEDGRVESYIIGGNGGYTYAWDRGDTTYYIDSLAEGIYYLSVTDSMGCSNIDSVDVLSPDSLKIMMQKIDITCYGFNDGQAWVEAQGGAAPYRYEWTTSPSVTDSFVNMLSSGKYYVYLYDTNDCFVKDSVSIVEPLELIIGSYGIVTPRCYGEQNGYIKVLPQGGSIPYNYLWSNGDITFIADSLAVGNHSVTVTDANGCILQTTYNMGQRPPVAYNLVKERDALCYNDSNGIARINGLGGAGNFTYTWGTNPEQYTQRVTNLKQGVYHITVADKWGCDTVAELVITQPDSLYATHNITPVSCFEGDDGVIEINAIGGTISYTFNWVPYSNPDSINDSLKAGTYYLFLKDNNACMFYDTMQVVQPSELLINIDTTIQTSCYNSNDGSIKITASGANGDYSFLWDNGMNTNEINGLVAGEYIYTVKDIKNCTKIDTIQLFDPPLLSIANIYSTDVLCYGDSNGTATIIPTGGTVPYYYLWTTGDTTSSVGGLKTGQYFVTVSDKYNCDTVIEVNIGEPLPITFSVTDSANISCNGMGDGAFEISVTGGIAPFNILWSNGDTGVIADSLFAGTYTVTVYDNNACSYINNVTINDPSLLNLGLIDSINPSCYGYSDGVIQVTGIGGTAPYTYNWFDGDTSSIKDSISYGLFRVTVTDFENCQYYRDIYFPQPEKLKGIFNHTVDIKCHGATTGEAEVTVTGGTAPYTYSWTNGETTNKITNVGAGVYTVTVLDQNECTTDTLIYITLATPEKLKITNYSKDVTCKGYDNGIGYVIILGGNPPYNILWETGATIDSIIDLSPGTYQVIVTDSSTCIDSLDIVISEPDSLKTNPILVKNVSCFNGTDGMATAIPTGGNGGYMYSWSLYFDQLNDTAKYLRAGEYKITVTDSEGCVDSSSIVITQPTQLEINSVNITNVSCFSGSNAEICIGVTGGTLAYQYLWSNSDSVTTNCNVGIPMGEYHIIVKDNNECTIDMAFEITEPPILGAEITVENIRNVSCYGGNDGSAKVTVTGGSGTYTYLWSNTQTTDSAVGLIAGTYFVTVTDSLGCDTVLSVIINEPPILGASFVIPSHIRAVSCKGGNDGSAKVTVTGGSGTYTYLWSNTQTIDSAVGLIAGTYFVTVTDSLGCDTVLSVIINEPPILGASFAIPSDIRAVSCHGGNDGSAKVTVTGGSGTYTYLWSDALSQTTDSAVGLIVGTYFVTITDSLGCDTVLSVTINEPPILGASFAIPSHIRAVSCKGGNDGSAKVTVTGGSGTYTYLWSNTQTTDSAVGLIADTYFVTITDSLGCDTVLSVTINEPPILGASFAIPSDIRAVSCYGGNDGSAKVTVTGGSGTYTYLWSNTQTTDSAVGLIAGTYFVTVTDSLGCDTVLSVTINEPPILGASFAIPSDIRAVSCHGGNDGSAKVTVTGGSGTYTYLWSDALSQTTDSAVGLIAGTYFVTVTDSLGCDTVLSVIINEPPILGASFAIPSHIRAVSCYGGNDGSAKVTVTGGSGTYTYLWSNTQTTDSAVGLIAGTYFVTVTDSLGCDTVLSVIINEPPILGASFAIPSDIRAVSCYGGNDGSAKVTVTGGSGTYTYLWSNTQTTDSAVGLIAGTYFVTVTDSLGCDTVLSVIINEPPILGAEITVENIRNVSCKGGNDGSAKVTVTGGSGTYTYLWSNAQTTDSAVGLIAGTYFVTITDSLGCDTVLSVTINEPPILGASFAIPSDIRAVSCYGGNDGSAKVTVTGGSGTYTYLWSNTQTTDSAVGLISGIYFITVTDSLGCDTVLSVTINGPPILGAEITVENIRNVSCKGGNDGSAKVTVTGGSGTYTYLWSNTQTIDSAVGLIAGTYFVTVTDSLGCDTVLSVTINEPSILGASFAIPSHIRAVSCYGGNDGSAKVTVTGGSGTYTYLWSNTQITDSAVGLIAGTYFVTITDSLGCDTVLSVTINEPPILGASFAIPSDIRAVSCYGGNDGSAKVTVTGGSGTYTYLWSDGQVGDSAISLIAGTYFVTITDSLGCDTVLSVTINEPPILGASFAIPSDIRAVSCYGGNDGSAKVTVTGGSGTYTYLWSNTQTTDSAVGLIAGTYFVTVTDSLGCDTVLSVIINEPPILGASFAIPSDIRAVSCYGGNDGSAKVTVTGGSGTYTYLWSNTQTTDSAVGLIAGTYFVTVTDSLGCDTVLSVIINEPPILGAEITVENIRNVSCKGGNDGSAKVTVTGGSGTYTYLWSNTQTTDSAVGLIAGTYFVTITDSLGCDTVLSVTINEPPILGASFAIPSDIRAVSCYGGNDGSAKVTVTGGSGTYTYLWSNTQTTDSAVGLISGIYFITVTDSLGCDTVLSVTINEPPILGAEITVENIRNVSCKGGNDGSAKVTVTGGSGTYTYLWSNTQTIDSAVGLIAGTYFVTVTDSLGCDTVLSVTINEPSILGASFAIPSHIRAVSCYGGNDGSAKVTVTGGSGTYTYLWSNTQITDSAVGLIAGTYFVTITDSLGCDTVLSVTINEPPILGASFAIPSDIRAVSCYGGNDGSAKVTVTGGSGTYTYLWSDGQVGDSAISLIAGTYFVTITDSLGCDTVLSVIINEPPILGASFAIPSHIRAVSCYGGNDGSAKVTVTGGSGTYTYLWSNTQPTDSAVGLIAGTYFVTVTDSLGCDTVLSVTINEPPILVAEITVENIRNVSCYGGNDGSAKVTVTGGSGTYTYLWSNTQTIDSAVGLIAGTYFVTVTDSLGCDTVLSVTINEPPILGASFAIPSHIRAVSCYGGNDGSAKVTVTGGSGTYTYLWSNTQTTDSAVGLIAGTYFVTITDSLGCDTVLSVTINEPPILGASFAIPSDIRAVSCHGGNDGSAKITVTGGSGTYTYLWSNTQTIDSAVGLIAGTYFVTVTDSLGCDTVLSVTINEPPILGASFAIPSDIRAVSCYGGNDGSAKVTVTGGSGTYTYLWSNTQTTDSAVGLIAGTYFVTITDSLGCDTVLSVIINEPPILGASFAIPSHIRAVSCYGGNDGSAKVTVTGGSGTYTYLWSNTQTTDSAVGLIAGTYFVTITDSLGCDTVLSVTINEPPILGASFAIPSDIRAVSCHGGNDGSAKVTVTGGSGTYTYLWSNTQTTDSAVGLIAGTYFVTVTDSLGCDTVLSVIINEPPILVAEITVENIRNVSCKGGNDGSAKVTVTGGSGTYTYLWSDALSQTTDSAVGLIAGTYFVTITDSLGCDTVLSVTINEPPILGASFAIPSDIRAVSCYGGNDGSAKVTVTGGSGTYTYLWSNTQTTDSAVGLISGTYFVTVTDSLGCDTVLSVTINEPPILGASFAIPSDIRAVSCYGGNDGSAKITVTGGSGTYTYFWSDALSQITDSAVGLIAGTYFVTVTDSLGCDTVLSVTINEPPILGASFAIPSDIRAVSCYGGNDGSAKVTVTGGSGTYTYLWSNTQTTDSAVGLIAGTYFVTVTDSLGCDTVLSVIINEPPILGASFAIPSDIRAVSCYGGNDGSAKVTVTGGSGTYTYLWSDGQVGDSAISLIAGTYFVTITDSLGCDTVLSVTINEPPILGASFAIPSDIRAVSCYGGNDGSAKVTVTGGSGTYTYLWSNTQTTDSAVGLIAGTYFVTVTDSLGCDTVLSVTINEPPILGASFAIPSDIRAVSCYGGNDGSAKVTVTGGSGTYTYLWSNTQTTDSAVGLIAGTYFVTVTDSLGCDTVLSVIINEPPILVAEITVENIRNVSCKGGNDGSAKVTVTGGSGTYTYLWSNTQTIDSAVGLIAGTYFVTVTDSLGCDTVLSVTINEPPILGASFAIPSHIRAVSCYGGNDGSAKVTVTGGSGTYTYLWSNTQTIDSAVGLIAGTYFVTITDSLGCDTVLSVTINEPPILVAEITVENIRNVSCKGGNDGSAKVTVTGGSGTYTYLWSNTQTIDSAVGLIAGTYFVTVTDSLGCDTVLSVTINEPPILGASFAIPSDIRAVSCKGGNDGSAKVTVTGGSGTYTYLWSNTQTTDSAVGLIAGTYFVTITDSLGCDTVLSVTINEPPILGASFAIPSDIRAVSCYGGNDGSAKVTVTGGSGTYTYLWSNTQTTDSAVGLIAGTYFVTVTDSLGCDTVLSVIINEPPILGASFAIPSDIRAVSCYGGNDGSAKVTVTGGSGTYTYLWSNTQTTDSAVGLIAGTYFVTITDSLGCDTVLSVTINEPPILGASFAIPSHIRAVSCYGGNDGSAKVTVTGGSGTYTYLWSNTQTTDSAVGLIAGTYFVTVTDSLGCDTVLSVTINEPPILGASFAIPSDIRAVSCHGGNDGSAKVTVTGGSGTYTYLWSDALSQTTDSAVGLIAGTYFVTVTDSLGCDTVLSVTINEPPILGASFAIPSDIRAVSCYGGNDGSAKVTVTGGSGTYTYLWNNAQTTDSAVGLIAGTYFVTVTDSLACDTVLSVTINEPPILGASFVIPSDIRAVSCHGGNDGSAKVTVTGGSGTYTYLWSNTQTTDSAVGLIAGTYFVTVTDSLGCDTVLSVIINEPPILVAEITVENIRNVSCKGGNDGSAKVTVTGGSGTYTYLWSNTQTTDSAVGLTAGTYFVTVTDSLGCDTVLSVIINEPPILGASFAIPSDIRAVSCHGGNDGSAKVTVTGGSGTYTYLWSDALSQTTDSAVGLIAGTYFVTVTDSLGCDTVLSVTINEPPILGASFAIPSDIRAVSCYGGNDGSAKVTVTGGSGTYTYLWSNTQTTDSAVGLIAGTYFVTVTDSLGCDTVLNVIINEPPILVAEITVENIRNVSCYGGNDGSAKVTVTGGSGTYTYLWSNTQTTDSAVSLIAGTYFVTITDSLGCDTVLSVTINEPPILGAEITVENIRNVSCHGGNDGSAKVTVTGGSGTYTYLWSNTQTTDSAVGLIAGTYFVTITDSLGCDTVLSVTINEPPILGASFAIPSDIRAVSCHGGNDGSAKVTVTGGSGTYTYLWSDALSQTTDSAVGLIAGTYFVTITDSLGCDTVLSVTINEPPILGASFAIPSHIRAVSCYGGNDGSAKVTVTGGSGTYTYLWSNTQTTDSAVGLIAGTYFVTVTDSLGCDTVLSVTINEPPILGAEITVENIRNVSCHGGNDGSAKVTVTGGSGTYTYLWSNTQPTDSAVGLIAGTYFVTVTDSLGCDTVLSVTINEPPVLISFILDSDVEHVKCAGDLTGSAKVTTLGGSPSYNYIWSNNQTTEIVNNIGAGTYTVTVIDSLGCDTILSVTINEPEHLSISSTDSQIVCLNQSVEIAVNVRGGVKPYNYSWSNGYTSGNTQTITPINEFNSYIAIVTDSNGCIINSNPIVVNQYPQMTSNLSIDGRIPKCFDDTINVYIRVLGGTGGPYTFIWNDGYTSQNSVRIIDVKEDRKFYVTIRDYCTSDIYDSIEVFVLPKPFIEIAPTLSKGCVPVAVSFGVQDDMSVFIKLDSIEWNFGDSSIGLGNNIIHEYNESGMYSVSIKTKGIDDCVYRYEFSDYVEVYPYPEADFIYSPEEIETSDPEVRFTDISMGPIYWYWIFGDTLSGKNNYSMMQHPKHSYETPGDYIISLFIRNEYGCYDSISKTIKVKENYRFFAPNAITADGDGFNDYFIPVITGLDENYFEMWIFSRWGEEIYYTNDIRRPWDGRVRGKGEIVQVGVYVWMVKTRDINGKKHTHVGHITIVK